MQKTLIAGSVLLLLAVAGYAGMARQAQPAAPAQGTVPAAQQQVSQGSAMPVPTEGATPVVEKVVNPTSAPAPVAAEPEPGPSYFTAADVATHNAYTDCWISVNGSVFDMTGFDSVHPGGREAIMKLCGKDGTRAFSREDEHEERGAWQEIQQFKVGELRG